MRCEALTLFALLLTVVPVCALDNGQYSGTDPVIRKWFQSVRNQRGIPCCDVADGHLTTWRTKGDHYEIPIGDDWYPVPDEAIIRNYGNPMNTAVVWYTLHWPEAPGGVYIRCFVPGPGV
jgi:hypothetical protein